MRKGEQRLGIGVTRVDINRLLQPGQRLFHVRQRRALHHQGQGAQTQVVGLQAFGGLVARTLHFRQHEIGFDGTHGLRGDVVLQGEDVFARTLEALVPQLPAAHRLDQLHADAHPGAGLAEAALQHIAHAQIPTDLLRADRAALVGEAGTAGDDEEAAHPRQAVGEVVHQAVHKVVLPWVAGQVGKRQHGQRGLVRKGRGEGGNCLTRLRRRRQFRCAGRSSCFVDRPRRQAQLVAPSGHGHHSLRAHQLAQRRDLHRQVVLFHHQAGPGQRQ